MEHLATGKSIQLIDLAEFNKLMYGSDYLERAAYAWIAARRVTHASLVLEHFQIVRPESKIVGSLNGQLLLKKCHNVLQILLVLFPVGLAAVYYLFKGLLHKLDQRIWFVLFLLITVLFLLSKRSAATITWNLRDIASDTRAVSSDVEALQYYSGKEHFISDVYNCGMASFTFHDENACALKRPNGMGWYHIAEPGFVEANRRADVLEIQWNHFCHDWRGEKSCFQARGEPMARGG